MRVIWPMKSCEIGNKSEIILGCAEEKVTVGRIFRQGRPDYSKHSFFRLHVIKNIVL